jgi:hypothetical protein
MRNDRPMTTPTLFWSIERTTQQPERDAAVAQGRRLQEIRSLLFLPSPQAAVALQMTDSDLSGLQRGLLTMSTTQWDLARKLLVDHVARASGRTMSIERAGESPILVRLFRHGELADESARVSFTKKNYGWTICTSETMVRVVGAIDPETPTYPLRDGAIDPDFAAAVSRAHVALAMRMRPGEQLDASSEPVSLR